MPVCMHPDWKMALWNSFPAYFVAVSVAQEKPPADSPKMVTLLGSPPKAAMLSCVCCVLGGFVCECGGCMWVCIY